MKPIVLELRDKEEIQTIAIAKLKYFVFYLPCYTKIRLGPNGLNWPKKNRVIQLPDNLFNL